MTCPECGGPFDPDVTHVEHEIPCLCDGSDCDCPEVCANCCTDPGCALREPQETTVRKERDTAQAPSVELVQALLESENVVDRLTIEQDAAYAVIRRYLGGWRSGERMAVVMAGSPRPPSERIWMHNDMAIDSEPMSPAEVDAIRQARATTEEASHE